MFAIAAPAQAWSATGHMISGAIAYRILEAESPETLAKVVALLNQHPDYKRRWVRQVNADFVSKDQRDLYLFMLVTRWTDDIRRKRADDHRAWHFINFPYKPDDQPKDRQKPANRYLRDGFWRR
jgi:hypothetical protein